MGAANRKKISAAVGILLPLVAAVALVVWYRFSPASTGSVGGGPDGLKPPAVEVSSGSIELTPKVVELSGIQIVKATEPTRMRKLELRGQLAFDTNRLHAVNSRFPGQIMEIAQIEEPTLKSPGKPAGSVPKRQLSYTDRVTKGQQLAVVWSKDLGEKKSELVDAQARLMLDQITLNRLKKLAERGSIAERAVREAEKNVSLGVIAVEKAARTLRSWGINDEEIDRVKAEAELINQAAVGEKRTDTNWARVEVVAPIDGTVVEKNITLGDIVDTNDELFKIADLSVMSVWLHPYEEDLMYLRRVGLPIKAEVRIPANPDLGVLEASMDRIGDIIDPNEHTAFLIGSVDNSAGVLQAGQFVSATIPIWNEPDIVEIPTTALIDGENDSYIFVQTDPQALRFECRKVAVVRRQSDVVYLRSHLDEDQSAQGLRELHAGELVVARGALELRENLLHQRAANAPDAKLLDGAAR